MNQTLENLSKDEKEKIQNLIRYLESLKAHCSVLEKKSNLLKTSIEQKKQLELSLTENIQKVKNKLSEAQILLHDSSQQYEKIKQSIQDNTLEIQKGKKRLEKLNNQKILLRNQIKKLQKKIDNASQIKIPTYQSIGINTQIKASIISTPAKSYLQSSTFSRSYQKSQIFPEKIPTQSPTEVDSEINQIVYLLNNSYF